MRKILLLSLSVLFVGCGTTSKKLMDLPPLAETAPVQVFYSQPNLKYERVCEIEAKGNNSLGDGYTQKEDFEKMFQQEARKCGADLYIATLDGLTCDSKVVDLLEKDYEGIVPKFKAVSLYSADKNDQNSPLCNDVIARSLPKMADLSQAVLEVNNHYVEQLNRSYDHDLEKKVVRYNSLLKEASRLIADACKRSSTDSTCAMKNGYLDFANKSKIAKSSAIKKNANDVLKILSN